MTTIAEIVQAQHDFFNTGRTLDVRFRIDALKRLADALKSREKELTDALHTDLWKSVQEGYMCEIGLTLSEVNYLIRHVRSWSKTRRVASPIANFPSRSYVVQEPFGVALVMSPWNYPVLLTLEPLAAAVAAGNCCVVKPSAYSPAASKTIAAILRDTFEPGHVAVVEGGRQENQDLLEQHFDYIFFTGGVNVGKLVMEKAAQHLTPVTLELGGKSPCIVDSSANLPAAARRIAFGKYLNCGQTCVAPDYALVESSIHGEFVRLVKEAAVSMYGADALANADYGKIVNRKHFDRIMGLINAAQNKIVLGGKGDADSLRIQPTILDGVTPDDAIMQEEIFGPVLPILGVPNMEAARDFVRARPSPLALYVFTQNKNTERMFVEGVRYGGGCVNDTIIHLATSELAFGGIGQSGMGAYHGRKSFETFSHAKSIVKKGNWLDLDMRNQPYTSLKEKLIRMFLK